MNGTIRMENRRNKRTKLETFLIILLVVFFFAFVAFLLLSIILLMGKEKKPCMTENCISTSAEILSYVNLSSDPCTDFHEYACGSWIKNARIPDDQKIVSSFQTLRNDLSVKLKNILNAPLSEDAPIFKRNIKNMYNSCLDMDAINKDDSAPLENLLDKFGKWPLIAENWNEADVDLTKLMVDFSFMAQFILFGVGVYINETDSTRYAINIFPGTFMLEKSHYFEDENIEKVTNLKHFIINVANGLSSDGIKNYSILEVDKILQFEKNLTSIAGSRMSGAPSLETTVGNASEILRNKVLDFEKYIISKFEKANVNIDRNTILTLENTGYFEELPKILDNTPKRTIVNYLMWKLIDENIHMISQRFRDMGRSFEKAMTGVLEVKPLWQSCLGNLNDYFTTVISRLYVEKHFNPKAKEAVIEMIKDIKEAFISILDDATWMSSEAKSRTKKKIQSMESNIGYPEYLFNDTYLNKQFHSKILMRKRYFFENMLLIKNLTIISNLQKQNQTVDRGMWPILPVIVNAINLPNLNRIAFPAAVLQYPMYHNDRPKYLNFGAIGSIIGHEILHGFDYEGSKYDHLGNNRDWWPEEDKNKFINKTKCLVHQYNNYLIEEINKTVNGDFTLDENIADNTGLKASYIAYRNWVEKNGEEDNLPGLALTPDQLFFIKFGQNWCMLSRPEYLHESHQQDSHPPGKQRIIGSVSNLKEFSEAFNCLAGSPMNPIEKCAVW